MSNPLPGMTRGPDDDPWVERLLNKSMEVPTPEYQELKFALHRKLLDRVNLEAISTLATDRVRGEIRSAVGRLVEEERAVSPAVLNLIAVAEQSFRGWVDALTNEGRVTADPRELRAAIAAVDRSLPGASPGEEQSAAAAPAAPIAPAAPSNVIELPRNLPQSMGAPAPGSVSPILSGAPPATEFELIELPELGFGGSDGAHVVAIGEPVDETIEMVDISVPATDMTTSRSNSRW